MPIWANGLVAARDCPRCGAKTRRGTPCRAPAVAGRPRCRLHGCAPGSGAPRGARNGNYRTGAYTREAREYRRQLRALLRMLRTNGLSLHTVEAKP
ncbi:MAG: hypothetical protein FJX53_02425 [Alphaproteobacteria bacterium]|nr:hypothetical protein [Alphaproteobacteria bacterium]